MKKIRFNAFLWLWLAVTILWIIFLFSANHRHTRESPFQVALLQPFWSLQISIGILGGAVLGGINGCMNGKYLLKPRTAHYPIPNKLSWILLLLAGYLAREGYKQSIGWHAARVGLPLSTSFLFTYMLAFGIGYLWYLRYESAYN